MLKDIVKDLNFQNDYFSVLEQIINFMMKDAAEKAIPIIETYAMVKNLSECESAVEIINGSNGGSGDDEGDEGNESIVSEYYPWFKKIANFLHENPDEAKRIEERTKTENLEKFFGGD